MRVLVVCGLSETIASFVPTRRFSSVDLPAFGRPMNETKPVFMTCPCSDRPRLFVRRRSDLGGRPLADANLVNPPPFHFQHLDVQSVDVGLLADRRHPAKMCEQVAANRLEALALDRDVQAVHHLVDVDLAVEYEAPAAFVDHRFAL